MPIASLLIYVFSIGIALSVLYSVLLIYRKLLIRSLPNYLYFLSAYFVAGFIDLIGRYLATELFNGQPAEALVLLDHILIFLMFPFIPSAMYFFMLFNGDFAQQSMSKSGISVFMTFWAFFFLLLVIATKSVPGGQGERFSTFLISALDKTVYIFYLLLCVRLLLKLKKIPGSALRKALKNYSLLYLSGFAVCFILAENWIGLATGAHLLTIVLYFSLHVPPLLVLLKYFKESHPETMPLMLSPETDLENFFSSHELSKREKEIVLLILEGKSGHEIKSQLYISLHTVKNHIYHIYQKLGVKNRLQLSRLIRQFLQNR